MKNARLLKFMALAMAASMTLSPLTASAAVATATNYEEKTDAKAAETGGTIEGTGTLPNQVNKKVFRIVVPTNPNVNFTLDPQGVLNATDPTTYTVANHAVYFGHGDGTFDTTSDDIIIGNKSSYDVDVSMEVQVKVANGSKIQVATNSTAASDSNAPALYVGLKTNTGAAIDASETAVATPTTLRGYAELATNSTSQAGYYVAATPSSSGGKTYTYEMTTFLKGLPATSSDLNHVTYNLEAECGGSNWAAADTAKIAVIWKVKDGSLPKIASGNFSRAGNANTFAITSRNNLTIAQVGLSEDGKQATAVLDAGAYSLSGENLVIDGTKAPFGSGAVGTKRYLHVKFSDGSIVVFAVNVTA